MHGQTSFSVKYGLATLDYLSYTYVRGLISPPITVRVFNAVRVGFESGECTCCVTCSDDDLSVYGNDVCMYMHSWLVSTHQYTYCSLFVP